MSFPKGSTIQVMEINNRKHRDKLHYGFMQGKGTEPSAAPTGQPVYIPAPRHFDMLGFLNTMGAKFPKFRWLRKAEEQKLKGEL